VTTIDALEQDILLQISALSKFTPQAVLSESQQRYTIFCGSGDSFAASMLGQVFSNFRVKAFDPLDLVKNKSLLERHTPYIVSISGKTIANIRVAKLAKNSVAITSNKSSPLARASSKLIPLEFPNSDVFTAGSISFLESALTCMSLVTSVKIRQAEHLFKEAKKLALKTSLSKQTFFLGNLQTYPVAMYAAAKIYEVLGASAFYERIEQFSHMELFSVNKDDTIILFEETNNHNRKLIKNLKKLGLKIYQPISPRKDQISQIIFYIFFSQMLPLFLAKRRNQKEVHFMVDKKQKTASDGMIY
jgi:fructoselysine-6-P-deglycase FrlB-like protein